MTAAMGLKHPSGPKNGLSFFRELQNNPGAYEKAARCTMIFIKIFAKLPVTGAIGSTYQALDFTVKTMNVIQIAAPIAYFANGRFLNREKSPANSIFFGAHLYVSICDVAGWVSENAGEIAATVRSLGSTYPLIGRIVSVNLAKYVLPVALVMFVANAYIAGDKLVKAIQMNDVIRKAEGEEKLYLQEKQKREAIKASLQLAWSVGQIALTSFAMMNIVNPYFLGGIVVAELATHAIGLVGDGYGVYNP